MSLMGILGWFIVGHSASAQTAPAPMALTNYTQKIPGSSVSFEMVVIPGGTLTLGSPTNEPNRGTNELVTRAVTVKPYVVGRARTAMGKLLGARDFTEVKARENFDEAACLATITKGLKDSMAMSGFADHLTAAEMSDLVRYVKALSQAGNHVSP